MKKIVPVTIVVLFFLILGACASSPSTQTPSPLPPPTPTPTYSPPLTGEFHPTSPQDIVGIWDSQVLYERGYHQFREDGTLVIAYSYEELETNPVFSAPSKYWFEGEIFHVEDSCGHGTYILTLTRIDGRNQKLSFQLINDPCEQRIIDWKKPMRWVEP